MKALVVDDEQNIRKVLRIILSEMNFSVQEASSVSDADTLTLKQTFDIALVDLRLPDGSGIDVLKKIKSRNQETCIIVITAFASTENAVEAMRAGAYDYLIKPFNIDEIRIKIKNIRDNIVLLRRIKEIGFIEDSFEGIIGSSEHIRTVFNMIKRIAPFDTSVLITGESGTGKELAAKAIHKHSNRSDHPFVTINCASLPAELLESELFGYMKGSFTGASSSKQGLIEAANGGSLFLDEIGEMPNTLQAKLLRFLEDKRIRPIGGASEIEVDVRIIAASNRDLSDESVFRKDLFFRIATFVIKMPPLRDRKGDIPAMVDYFIKVFNMKFDKHIELIDPSFIQSLMGMRFEGNVRELKNLIERAVIMSDSNVLTAQLEQPTEKEAPITLGQGFDLNKYLLKIEEDLLYNALKQSNHVKTKAAELLGISFREFRYRLSKFEKQANKP